jgi:WD repeat-containing protein 23
MGSVVARHEWKGLLKMPGALEDLVEKRLLESQDWSTKMRGSPGHHLPSESDDEYMSESDEEDD